MIVILVFLKTVSAKCGWRIPEKKKKERQEDLKLWASLAYLVELCQKQTKQQKQFYDKYTGFLIHGSSALVNIIMKRNYYKLKNTFNYT